MNPPEWLLIGRHISNSETFTPIAMDRQGERMAWSLAMALLALLIYLRWSMQIRLTALLVIFVLLFLAAILISFGTWMERRTRIDLSPEGMRYKNPLRDRWIRWEDLTRIHAYPRGSGWRVLVESSIANFSFQTGTVLNTGWGSSIKTGVVGGEDLVSGIVGLANLSAVSADREGWTCSRSLQPPA